MGVLGQPDQELRDLLNEIESIAKSGVHLGPDDLILADANPRIVVGFAR